MQWPHTQLGVVAKGMDACDSFFSSTSLCSMLYKEAKMLHIPVLCLGMVAKGMDARDSHFVPHPLRCVLYQDEMP